MSRQALTAAHEYEREKQLKRFIKLIEDVPEIKKMSWHEKNTELELKPDPSADCPCRII
jgi:hypothetical protein